MDIESFRRDGQRGLELPLACCEKGPLIACRMRLPGAGRWLKWPGFLVDLKFFAAIARLTEPCHQTSFGQDSVVALGCLIAADN